MQFSRKTVLGFKSERNSDMASAVLSEWLGFESFAFVVREDRGKWLLECYDDGYLAEKGFAHIREIVGINICSLAAEIIPQMDWVAETHRLLPPVRAGRFIVHGSHDRGKLCSRWAIEIEAGRAFGTAHHGTTKGCLMAIEMLARIGNPGTVLDIGTGSGVLAIAAAKAFCHSARVSAIDIDPVAVEIARQNCRKNGVVSSVSVFVGDGTRQTYACRAKPFGLLMANILAKPLLRLAPSLSGLTKRGGFLVLSGLLADQGREVLARYRETGFCLMRRIELEGWATLMLKRTR